MALKQISVLIENKKGALLTVTDALAGRKINIRALSIADTERFGILRMIVSDNDAAVETLRPLGLILQETEVVGVRLDDKPGQLSKALQVLDEAGINMEYLYAFFANSARHAYVVIRVEDNPAAEAALTDADFHLIEEADLETM